MRLFTSFATLLLLPGTILSQQQAIPYTSGMVITSSVKIVPGRYLAPSDTTAGMVVRGDSITVDLRGVELVGSSNMTRPDQFHGFGIVIEDGSDVTILGATVSGYKIAILARRTVGLNLLGNDLSHNWKPRLFSKIEKESLVDWMSFHSNENAEWISAGAAIYLHGVVGGEIKGNTVRQGSSALMMSSTNGMRVWNNDFSYNSALGIAMYRSSNNIIMHNRVDYNVRGYQDGFYNRGQDSAGILMYEQCMNNVVAFNSVTHSGDGLFIWAGQSTMDTGEGGVNNNIFFGNDFSHAPTNGIENTFSSNVFANNRIEENWHGVWGGYSWQSTFIGNHFINNDEAITIEHGQDIRIVANTFSGDTTAIRIWQNPTQPADWGYPQHRDTRSRDYVILGNSFDNIGTAFNVTDSKNVRIDGNIFRNVDTLTKTRGDTARWEFVATTTGIPAPVPVPRRFKVTPLKGGMNAMIPATARRGRKTIIVDEWGPYDWQSPKLWPVGRSDELPLRLRVLGPKGSWRVASSEGVASFSAESGVVGDTLIVVPAVGRENDFNVELAYVGGAVISRFGELYSRGDTVSFGWERFEPEINWHLEFFPRDNAMFEPEMYRNPAATMDTTSLDLTWYSPPDTAIRQSKVRTRARGTVTLAPGRYLIRAIYDDAVVVSIDGSVVIEDALLGESRVKEAEFVATGTHQIEVSHWQEDGWYELRLDIEKVK